MGISIGKKRLKGGKYSLFLDICRNGNRQKTYLGIILDKPTTKEIRNLNREKLLLAKKIRALKELNMLNQDFFTTSSLRKSSSIFVENSFSSFAQRYKNKDRNVMSACLLHYRKFIKDFHDITVSELNKEFCKKFLEYLYLQLHGSSPANYFKKFKLYLKYLQEEHVLNFDPSFGIILSSSNYHKKETLTSQELDLLLRTPCKVSELKRAFLFSCNTGLRWCDVNKINASNLEDNGHILHLIQSKVNGRSQNAELRVFLNETARQLLRLKEIQEPRIFYLPSYSYCTRILSDWTEKAGIHKHITFHCARHTFITNLIDHGVNLKTVSYLAGHSTCKHTERYIHAIDKRLMDAVNSLDKLDVKQIN